MARSEPLPHQYICRRGAVRGRLFRAGIVGGERRRVNGNERSRAKGLRGRLRLGEREQEVGGGHRHRGQPRDGRAGPDLDHQVRVGRVRATAVADAARDQR